MSDVSAPPMLQRLRILFVCEGNTCRSVLAEYIAKKKFDRTIDPFSAGLRPGTVENAENAIYILMDLFGVDASSHQPRDVQTMDVKSFDLVVTMTNQIAAEVRQLFPNLPAERLVKWRINDPFGDDLAEYRRCAHAIHAAMTKLKGPRTNAFN